MSLNITQTISSPTRTANNVAPSQVQGPSDNERECWNVCRDRFKYVVIFSVICQLFILITCSIIFNIGSLHKVSWIRETFTILCSPLMFVVVVHGYFKLKPYLQHKIYHPTRFAKFIGSFSHESCIFLLNLFFGLFTSLLFIRCLQEDYKTFTYKTDGKKLLNEKYVFLLFNGAFIRCYFFFKQRTYEQNIEYSIIHQSKLLQMRRKIITVFRTSFVKTLLPTVHCFGAYVVVGSSICFILRRLFGLDFEEVSILDSFSVLINLRLLAYSWILSSVIWSNMSMIDGLINIFSTELKEFPIEGNTLTLLDALSLGKLQITQQLAAQDFYILADSPNNVRRKQFYALSFPGGHPHNWKAMVQKSLEIINKFSDEIKSTLDTINKSRNNNNNALNFNQPLHQFFESKRIVRDANLYNGVRSLAASPLKYEPMPIEKPKDILSKLSEKLLSNKFIFYIFGEVEGNKFNFLFSEKSLTVEWLVQGISAIVARSVVEDSYGVVQQDIKQILKSMIKLKTLLDKVATVNIIAKDRNFVSLKAAVRRSLYRIANEFSNFFDDLMLDSEDVKALHSFVTFREL